MSIQKSIQKPASVPVVDKPVRVAIYTRVSTDEQNVSGYGMEMQEESLRTLVVNYKSVHNSWVYNEKLVFKDEGKSGADLNRPAFKRMMECVRNKEIDIIAVYKIDRVSRNLSHLLSFFEEIQKYGASFFSLKENIDFSGPIGKLTFQIFGALAEFERETIRTRTADGKIASARMGNFVSNGPPYGYETVPNMKIMKGKVLKIVTEEKRWVETVFEWFVYDRKNYSEIARELNKMKLPKGKGSLSKNKLSTWHDTDVAKMLIDSTYNGINVMRIKDGNGIEQEIKNQVGKIVNDTLFLGAQSIIREVKETRGKKGGGKNIYLLSRKLIYRASGRGFIGYNRGKGGCGYRHKKFIDSKTGIEYPNIEISASVLDEFVWEYVKLAIEKPKEFYAIYQKQTAQDDELQNLLSSQEKWIESISEHEVYLISLEDEYIRGKISEERKEDLNNRYEGVIRESKIKLTESNERIAKLVEAKTASDALERFSKNFKTKINNLSIEEKQTLVDTLVECIEVQKVEGKILADIYFRFAQSRIESEGDTGEPKDGFQTLKSPLSETRSEHMEAPSGVEPDYGALQAPA